MSTALLITIALLSGIAGFGAGFIGLGGGLLLFPLLFYLPPLLGMESLDAKTVAALVLSQVFFSGVIAGAAHWRKGRVHRRLTLVAAVSSASSSFVGGVVSKWASDWLLLLLFGCITLLAATLISFPGNLKEIKEIPVENIEFPSLPLAIVSCAIGLVVGLLGAGNFLFIPFLIYFFKIPIRVTIGSSLVVYVFNTFAGFLGKLLSGQISFLMILAVLIGAGMGAVAGEWSHSRVSPRVLRYLYATAVGVVAGRIWLTLLF